MMSQGKKRKAASGAGISPLPRNLEFILEQAVSLLQQGQLGSAEVYFRQVLTAAPQHLDALQFLGVIEYQKGRFEAAAELLQRAVALAPEAPGLHCNLGLAQQGLGRPELALASYEQALALKPRFAEALNNRGNVLRELGRLAEAEASYRRALSLGSDFVEALYNLGITLMAQSRAEDALVPLVRCLRLAPDHIGAWGQYGVALMALGKHTDALACFERLLSRMPNDAEAHYWRGNALLALRRSDEALQAYGMAAQLRPDIPEVHYNIGNVLVDLGRVEEGIAALDQALSRRPDYLEALYNRGGALQELGRYDEAASSYERLMALAPGHRYALGKLFHCRQFAANWRRHAEQRTALAASADGVVRDLPFPFLAVSDDPALQLRCAQAYTAAKYPPAVTPLCNARPYAHVRIRIAYISTDFREHALSYLLAGVFEAHDRTRFEIWGVSLKPGDGSAMANRVAAAFEHFVDVSAMSDDEVARLLRELEIDIAVDLNGHTQDGRTAIFAARPAPVQVNYLGFPGSMGADYIDYIIADDFVIPEAARPHYAEQVVHLPECFQGNDDRRAIDPQPAVRAAHGLPEKAFVFCAFNNTYKLTPEFFDIWMHLLAAVPGSVLWLASADASVQGNLRVEAERRGIAPERLVFSPRIRYAEHLARLQLADLFLDTLPFNAGTTASDALWAGVPVLTCVGDAFSARMAGSLLRALGLPELITGNLAAYEARALELATNPAALSELRERLASNRATSPLFDTRRFTRHLEQAYQSMWNRQQQGEMPASFHVAPFES
ncbi:tetratricopeptide repeat protein [Ferribacterium limneticum]|uniref:tetratricopeptide repeat protein n=1 Tax=Ferribacterium limneticum TaxID=76259 RepID=UPI001CF97678|nr:tetratricopeptide repeat protein [Ferribacterium limneticum]UCV30003.1 tetratricopeptide repeat protein [Ferribacterium limneticum]UCV33922.1 tetratricopeptide repeat protein [Ferribacterium limneticum]